MLFSFSSPKALSHSVQRPPPKHSPLRSPSSFSPTLFPVFIRSTSLSTPPDTLEELLDRHVVKREKSLDDHEEELLARQRLLTTRREALSLYRDIIRATRFFMWPDSRGILWRDILRENARKEFEEARFEKDPETVNRLLIGGRGAVESALEKLAEKQRQQIEKERGDGGDGR